MRIFLEVEYESGEKADVTASAIDLMRFEDKYELSIVKLDREVKLTHLLFLAWTSLNRQKQTKLEFEPWAETVASIGLGSGDPK
tara:strand:+ start:207 stop:458 length:252 start_codon:yes stop_codon:yes gene_type:complete